MLQHADPAALGSDGEVLVRELVKRELLVLLVARGVGRAAVGACNVEAAALALSFREQGVLAEAAVHVHAGVSAAAVLDGVAGADLIASAAELEELGVGDAVARVKRQGDGDRVLSVLKLVDLACCLIERAGGLAVLDNIDSALSHQPARSGEGEVAASLEKLERAAVLGGLGVLEKLCLNDVSSVEGYLELKHIGLDGYCAAVRVSTGSLQGRA